MITMTCWMGVVVESSLASCAETAGGVPRLAKSARRLAPTVRCCLTEVRKPGVDMHFLLRVTSEAKLDGDECCRGELEVKINPQKRVGPREMFGVMLLRNRGRYPLCQHQIKEFAQRAKLAAVFSVEP